MRFENSPEISSWRFAGRSPVLKLEMVGKDNSSATQGSSTVRVAGKKCAPAKQWAAAGDAPYRVKARVVSAAAMVARLFCRMRPRCTAWRDRRIGIGRASSENRKRLHQTRAGGPRGLACAFEVGDGAT